MTYPPSLSARGREETWQDDPEGLAREPGTGAAGGASREKGAFLGCCLKTGLGGVGVGGGFWAHQ